MFIGWLMPQYLDIIEYCDFIYDRRRVHAMVITN